MLLHRLLHALNALLLVALFAHPLLNYDALPDRIPQHFDASGQPDAWADKSPWAVLMLPLLALGCVALLYGGVWFSARHPKFVNMPGKVPFHAWPPESQQRAMRALQTYMYATSTGLLVLFLVIGMGTTEAAHTGTAPGYTLGVTIAFLVLSTFTAPLLLYHVSKHSPRG